MRKLRLKWVRLIVIPFFIFAVPRPDVLVIGAAVAILGLWIRGWSAGAIHKDEELTTSGPYAFTRNPLYLGSFFIGVGLSIAGGHWAWTAVFVAFYLAVYTRTMAGETRHLTELFPQEFAAYAEAVPAFLPRITPYRAVRAGADGSAQSGDSQTGGFRWAQYRRNREWEASLGALAAFAILLAKSFFQ
jgi:hypothetical protein